MTRRGVIRSGVGDALEFSDWGRDFERKKSWGQAIGENCDAFGVSVLRDLTEKLDKGQYSHNIQLRVAFSRIGNDEVEDWIDEDGEEVERLVLEALEDLVFEVPTHEMEFETEARDGAQRIGACVLTFECVMHSTIG